MSYFCVNHTEGFPCAVKVKIHVSLLLHQEGSSLWGLIHSPSLQGCVCVVNAASNRDIEVFAAGMIQVYMTTVALIDLLLYIHWELSVETCCWLMMSFKTQNLRFSLLQLEHSKPENTYFQSARSAQIRRGFGWWCRNHRTSHVTVLCAWLTIDAKNFSLFAKWVLCTGFQLVNFRQKQKVSAFCVALLLHLCQHA